MITDVRERPDRARVATLNGSHKAQSWDIDLASGEGLTVILAYEPVHDDSQVPVWRWHLSVAGTTRVPKWNEVVAVVHRFRPGVMFCIPLPPRNVWLNEHEFCLHVWEIADAPLVESWRGNPRVSDPT